MKRILGNKLFMASFVSDMLSNFGDVLYYLALMNYVLLLPDAKLAISLVTLSETLPYLTMIFMGMWGDKTKNKVDTILATQFFRVGLYVLVGLAMGFPPALWIVIVAVIANLLSDLAGQYENALYTPLSLRVVADEDRETMYAFRQATRSVLQIVFQSSGALLITLMTYQQLAFVNAGTFLGAGLIMLVLRPAFQKLLKERPIEVAQHSENQGEARHFFANSWQSLKASYQVMKNLPLLQTSIMTIACLNAVFVAVGSLLVLTIKDHPSFVLINPATTLATFSIMQLLGNVVGSVLGTTLFKALSFETLLKWSTLMPVLMFTSFLLHNTYMVFLVIFATTMTVGIFSPKMQAYVVRSIPEESLATVGAGINTFCTFGMVGAQFILSGLVLVLSSDMISLLFLALSLLLFGVTIKNSLKKAEPVQATDSRMNQV
ncbi:MFS transporter [Streptococcus ovuberis]|uniref:MFS transporter n=1 Tax=Streptococcus ovuberis TaxID=1936207 RepID=A0A7X6S0W1_9STRE|nr:MFS transporter [Streptococcus ovuberis]